MFAATPESQPSPIFKQALSGYLYFAAIPILIALEKTEELHWD
jgi:hypothetical protein